MAKSAATIFRYIKNKKISLKDLSVSDKRNIAFFLFEQGKHHAPEIADYLGYSVSRINQLKAEYKKKLTHLVDELDVKKLAADTIMVASRSKIELNKQGRWDKAWQVQKELVASLQELGYIHKAPIEHKVTLQQEAIEFYRLLGINKEVNFANSN